METGRKMCVMDDDVQKKSSSSSENPALQSADKMAENKLANPSADESSDDVIPSQSQSQVENIDVSINDLPPEILMQILENLDTRCLFKCRRVDRQFNSISTEILCVRREVEVKFKITRKCELMLVKSEKRYKKNKSLRDFTDCMKQSENCPFVRFSFEFSTSSLSSLDYFLSEFNLTKIKSFKVALNLGTWGSEFSSSEVDFIPKVGDLLLNKIPHVEEFGLSLPCRSESLPKFQKLELFSSSGSSSIKLPHLKVVHFSGLIASDYPEIVDDLLTAAVNLRKIQPFYQDSFPFEGLDFYEWNSLGKLDCLQEVSICPSPEFIREMKEKLPNLPHLFKLSKLILRSFSGSQLPTTPESQLAAGNFVSALFESSKNTLTSLKVERFWFWPNLQFPRFTKLEKLSLSYGNFRPLFSPGFDSLDIFPAVRDLELNIDDWRGAFPEGNSFPCFPHVQWIRLIHYSSRYKSPTLPYRIQQLASMCPNVKHLKITPAYYDYDVSQLNFLQAGRAIATHMPKLESLELFIDLELPENNPQAIDSFFTGFSEENCKRLLAQSSFDEAVKKPVTDSNSNHDDKMTESESSSVASVIFLVGGGRLLRLVLATRLSESELMPESEYPSIFHMKKLKKLTVNPRYYGKWAPRKRFLEKLTWISKMSTLNLMPRLKITRGE